VSSTLRFIGIAALATSLVCAGVPDRAVGADPRVRKCAKRVTKGIQAFSEDFLELVGECHFENLVDDEENIDCSTDEDVLEEVAKSEDKLNREVRKCDVDAFRAICPLSSRNTEEFSNAILTGPTAYFTGLDDILHGVFVESHAPECPRPPETSEPTSEVEDCAKEIQAQSMAAMEELQKCFFGCMQSELQAPLDEPCIDENTGFAINNKLASCIANVNSDFTGNIVNECESDPEEYGGPDAFIQALGCPMGASTLSSATTLLWSRIDSQVRATNLKIFVSPCRTTIDGGGGEGGELVPANVTLLPSLTTKQVNCGDVLNASFFGSDTAVRFDTDLDCGPATTPTDGIVVAVSGVTIDGNARSRLITGPSGGANRTGTGIRVAPGATSVKIKDFKGIDFFGVGIGDAGNNTGLEIDRVTVRRNTIAGIRLTTPGADVEDAVADRNVIGFDMSGDDSQLRKARARRAGPLPGYGIYLHGTDANANGRTVRVSESDVEDNVIGVWAEGQGHRIEQNEFRGNTVQSAVIAGTGIRLDDNSIKLGAGDGVLVSGDANVITANRSDQNLGAGFVVSGDNNQVNGNGAGSLTDLGNGGAGYRIEGTGNDFASNRAEANVGAGFHVLAANIIRSNDSRANQGPGFQVSGSGSSLNTNVGEANAAAEFVIAAGNIDQNGNRANGATFNFGAGGGSFE
jgi:hypothetical protein